MKKIPTIGILIGFVLWLFFWVLGVFGHSFLIIPVFPVLVMLTAAVVSLAVYFNLRKS